MVNHKKIFVAGHRGMVGGAIIRALRRSGVSATAIITRTRSELDLTNQDAVNKFFETERPNSVYLSAAKVQGINANNTYPADFIYENLMIESNVVKAAHENDVQQMLFLGSSCIYPRNAPQPMKESALFEGKLEPTNEAYAVAKIAGIKLCESFNRQYGRDYRCIMPTNLFGPGDNYHPMNSHVIPALLRRFHEAKTKGKPEVEIWGTGNPRREFLYVDDLAAACLFVMGIDERTYRSQVAAQCSHINAGYGEDVSIAELAQLISVVVGYKGTITFNHAMPDGSPRKLIDSSKLHSLGWKPETDLASGLQASYRDFIARYG